MGTMLTALSGPRLLLLHLHGSSLRRLDLLAVRIGPARHRPAHLRTGEYGEREALFALRRRGSIVVARRWQSSRVRGDVDLIAWEDDVLCFVEVKTRTERNPLDPAEAAVDRDKQQQLRRLAGAYLRSFPESRRDRIPIRFDVAAVYLHATRSHPHADRSNRPQIEIPEIEYLPNAFSRY